MVGNFCIYRMARRADIIGFIRGLESIGKALIETQGGEVKQAWRNSSLRSASKDIQVKAEEVVSDVVSKQPELQVISLSVYNISNINLVMDKDSN